MEHFITKTSFPMSARPALQAGAFFIAAALVAASAGSAPAQDKAMTVKLATASLNDVQHEWMKRFAAAIEKSSAGRIRTELYPASQLGAIPRMIEATQLGSIQVWVGPPDFLAGVDPRFELVGAPGVFQDDQHARKTIADPESQRPSSPSAPAKAWWARACSSLRREPTQCGCRSALPRTSRARKSA
jgi:hypothetical protein